MYKEIHTKMVIAVKNVFIPISENCLNQLWYIHITKYYIAVKLDELDIYVSNK